MRKYVATIDDKSKVDQLMVISRRLNALRDLNSTLLDKTSEKSIIEDSQINPGNIENEINELVEKKEKAVEKIRIQYGWTKEDMGRIHIMENYKVYMDTGESK